MGTAVPTAVDEQLRVEALRAAVAVAFPLGMTAPQHVLACAEVFEAWLLREGSD